MATLARDLQIHITEQNCSKNKISLRGLQIDQALAYSPFQCKSTNESNTEYSDDDVERNE
eukprot:scaffold30091_cov94-Skeletonema_dohrnii-CCMP3373.AAC.1